MNAHAYHVRTPEWTGTIPEAWVIGFAQGHPYATVGDAVCTWLEQCRMEQEAQLERD
jgi:hypothetical protein